MKKGESTRNVVDMRHYNDQNPNINPARTRARAPQLVRAEPYHKPVKTIAIPAKQAREVGAYGRTVNGAPIPITQAVKKYE